MTPEQDRKRCIGLLTFGILLAILSGCTSVSVVVCPKLPAVPGAVIDQLEALKTNPEAAAWTIDLERFYRKQDLCGSGTLRPTTR